MKRIVIFASGSGTNAENIIKYFKNSTKISIELILSNKKDAGVLEKANCHQIRNFYFDKNAFYKTNAVLETLQNINPHIIVLAGFLWKFPATIIDAFPNKIINIHPSLLPKYGGKGMYGMHVHKAVLANKETETGITIHYVNEDYDKGNIIFQAKTKINMENNANDIAKKVHELEYEHFPKIIKQLLDE